MKFRDMEDSPFLKLEYIYRFSNRPLMNRDSDADHTIRLQLYLLEAYTQVPDSFDLKEACYKALIHDLDEIGSGDINRIFKYKDSELHDKIEEVSREMMKESGLTEEIILDIDKSKDNTIEGFLIRFFDAYDAERTLLSEYEITRRLTLFKDSKVTLEILNDILTNFVPEGINYSLLGYIRGLYNNICSRNISL